jgi:hypothetical protein
LNELTWSWKPPEHVGVRLRLAPCVGEQLRCGQRDDREPIGGGRRRRRMPRRQDELGVLFNAPFARLAHGLERGGRSIAAGQQLGERHVEVRRLVRLAIRARLFDERAERIHRVGRRLRRPLHQHDRSEHDAGPAEGREHERAELGPSGRHRVGLLNLVEVADLAAAALHRRLHDLSVTPAWL